MRNFSATVTGVRLPRAAVRVAVKVLVQTAFGPWVPNAVRRWWLDACSVGNRVPRGTEVRAVRLGEVPGVRVAHPGADSNGVAAGRAVLYLHGGGYTTGSSRTHRALAGHLSRAVAAPVFLLDYRLAPEHPYPAALMDALAAYRALHRAGYPPERIVLAGDSAGGGWPWRLRWRCVLRANRCQWRWRCCRLVGSHLEWRVGQGQRVPRRDAHQRVAGRRGR